VELKRSAINHSISRKWHYAYLCALNYLDFQLGILFYKLQEWGFLTNSLIIITSDHGEEIYNHEITNSHGKSYIIEHETSYNTTIKIPLLIRHIKKCAYKSDDYISNVDILPTILDEIGLKVLEGIDGVSVFKSKRNSIYSHNSRMNCEVVIKDGYKLIHYGNYTELYNIHSDPEEKEKIIDPQIEAFLIRELNRFKEKDSGSVEKIDKSDEKFIKNSLIGLGYL
jgi:arylsulfatase A-like enzyme